MGDGDLDHLPRRIAPRIGRVGALHPQVLHPADEAQPGIAHQHAGQEPALDQDLEAVADAEHEPAPRRMGAHRIHDPRPPGDGPAAQVVAVAEAAG